MPPIQHKGGGIILASIIVALLLAMLPLPEWAQHIRPEWVTLVLIYWCMALPDRIGIGWAWLAGLMLDVTTGSLLGQHALSLAIVAFLTLKLHQRIRVFPLMQQAFAILVLVAMAEMINLWIHGIINTPPRSWTYWLPSLISAALWPWLFVVMRGIRRHFRVQ
ncbi:rod shape-determining protein MreD [Sulfuriflexus mobilis]|uniref:rod shape-determining protein MreD n=1 Tax=Sulfuriflexus mobilis TaxID=1811807 RepID=UPI000F844D77|nr:rod shape-determining protein MreD [Sulfuriflexus mobilis]